MKAASIIRFKEYPNVVWYAGKNMIHSSRFVPNPIAMNLAASKLVLTLRTFAAYPPHTKRRRMFKLRGAQKLIGGATQESSTYFLYEFGMTVIILSAFQSIDTPTISQRTCKETKRGDDLLCLNSNSSEMIKTTALVAREMNGCV